MNQARKMSSVTISKSKVKLFFGCCLLACIGGLAFGMGMLLGFDLRNMLDVLNLPMSAVFMLESILMFAGILILVRFSFDRRPGLSLTNEGFTFWHLKVGTRSVSWDAVERIEFICGPIDKLGLGDSGTDKFKFVNVYLRSNYESNMKVSQLKRLYGPGDIVIEHRYLSASAREVFELMTSFWKASRESGSEFSNYPRP